MVDMKARVEQARQCWNGGDLPGYLSMYDDGIKLHGYTPEPMDKPTVAAFYQNIWDTLSDPGKPPSLVFHQVLAEGDLYTCSFTMSGTHRGPFMGIPPTGKSYALPGITILRFAGGKVIERWSCADMLGLLVQLGAVPPPGG